MSAAKTFIAVDLGAGSGRVIAATVQDSRMRLEEIARFDNRGVDLPTGSYWNILLLYSDIIAGLRLAVARYGEGIVSIGIDSWGCDFAYLDADGEVVGLPHQYRDPRFEGMAQALHAIMPEPELYSQTGVKTNFYNSSLHLLADSRRTNPGLGNATALVFIPDLLSYWLTGRLAVERTIASTSQLLDAHTAGWAWKVIDAMGLPRKPFKEIVSPGTILGPLRQEVAAQIGLQIPVVATASHDTAAAVAGIPILKDHLWLSSGTWSIMGVEINEAITTPEALAHGFCNERGAGDTLLLLKNISGLWLIQECRRQWELEDRPVDFGTLAAAYAQAAAFTAWIDPDDPQFANPGGMPEKIRNWCAARGQQVPMTQGAILRVVTESLAMKYRVILDQIRELTGRTFSGLCCGGGGIQNESLCQAAANALGIPVVAGPVEATSCGNVIIQMIASGYIPDIQAGRDLIRSSFEFQTFYPRDADVWKNAQTKFQRLLATPLE